MTHFKSPEQIKVGVIGYGGRCMMGRIHLRDTRKAGMTPCAVVDFSAEQRQVAVGDYPGIETYANVGTMLRKSDANLIIVVTQHNTHARLALQCLRAGRHVVLEKPFAIRVRDCDRMIAEATKRNLLLSTYHNRHWDGCVLGALAAIRRGDIGRVTRIHAYSPGMGKPDERWRWSKRISGGIMYDWGVHFLEYALQIADSDPVEVSGFAVNGLLAEDSPWGDDTNEDEATVVVRFRNGIWLEVMFSNTDAAPDMHGDMQFRITGTDGVYFFNQQSWRLVRKTAQGGKTIEEGPNPPSQWENYYANLAAHLTTGEALTISPQWARRPVQILEAGVKSAIRGRTLRLDG